MSRSSDPATPPIPPTGTSPWDRLGRVEPARLVAARETAHRAVQLVAAAARRLAEPRPDDSHASLAWSAELEALVGRDLRASPPLRIGLRPLDLALVAPGAGDGAAAAVPLDGLTLDEAAAATARLLGDRGVPATGLSLEQPYELPPHPIEDGAPFDGSDREALAELADWFGAAHEVVEEVASSLARDDGASATGPRGGPVASAVRCWPHHFDIASLVTLPGAASDGEPRSVGLGLSPGDETSARPYFYVTPWPYPEPEALPALPSGRWQTEGWIGALLDGGDLAALHGGAARREAARAFLRTAVDASLRALG